MFGYNFLLAIRGIKRNRWLTVLMVLVIGFGIGASTITYAVFRAVSGDPIPWKSSRIFVPQIDPWGPTHAIRRAGEPPDALTYQDAMKFMQDRKAIRQSAIYQVTPVVNPNDGSNYPFTASGHAVYGDFFPMLDVPFLYGKGWSDQDDLQHRPVVVISSRLNSKLFGGKDSIGKPLSIQGKIFNVVGVLQDWDPQPLYYDIMGTGGFTAQKDDLFIPFTSAIDTSLEPNGFTMCTERPSSQTLSGTMSSSCVWISFLVQLDTADQVAAYQNYLSNYAKDQEQAGRFTWAPSVRLRDLNAWLDYHHVVPADTRVSFILALGLLVVCLANSAGVMLGKFQRRKGEYGIRRSLGASRADIYWPCFIEAGLVGLAGGLIGVVLTFVGIKGLDWVLPKNIAALAHLDFSLLLMTLAAAIIGTLLAALYPALRVSKGGLGVVKNKSPHFRMKLPVSLSALRWHKMSVSLIIVQVALSLAIVSNAVSIIKQRIDRASQPTGVSESDLFLVSQQWIGIQGTDSSSDRERLKNLLQTDIATIRDIPDVVSVASISAAPLLGISSNVYLNMKPSQQRGEAFAGLYVGDESILKTFGVYLVAGRDFTTDDVMPDAGSRPSIIITKALADKLFEGNEALGKTVYLDGNSVPSKIIGIIDRLHVPSVYGQEASSPWYSVVTAAYLNSTSSLYAIRAKPDVVNAAMNAVKSKLYEKNSSRIMDEKSIRSVADVRADANRADIGMAMLMIVVSVLLMAVTGAGVAGLSSAWVSERRQQIGIRRALGARKLDILRHFQMENLAITGTGIAIGSCLAYFLNLMLIKYFDLEVLPLIYIFFVTLIVAAVGQCSVFMPAKRASDIPPAMATRHE